MSTQPVDSVVLRWHPGGILSWTSDAWGCSLQAVVLQIQGLSPSPWLQTSWRPYSWWHTGGTYLDSSPHDFQQSVEYQLMLSACSSKKKIQSYHDYIYSHILLVLNYVIKFLSLQIQNCVNNSSGMKICYENWITIQLKCTNNPRLYPTTEQL